MAAIAIKIDEDLPAAFAPRLLQAGHDAVSIHGQGWTGLPDDQLWPRVQAEGRSLFTADKGFANANLHPPGTHAGIVLFRLPRESRRGYLRLLEFLIDRLDFTAIRGSIVVVSPDAIRVHRG